MLRLLRCVASMNVSTHCRAANLSSARWSALKSLPHTRQPALVPGLRRHSRHQTPQLSYTVSKGAAACSSGLLLGKAAPGTTQIRNLLRGKTRRRHLAVALEPRSSGQAAIEGNLG